MDRRLALGLAGFGAALIITLTIASVANADYVQPRPSVGNQITITGAGVAGACFDSLQNLKLSERYLGRWSDDAMDSFLSSHSVQFSGGEKARVLAVYPTYSWTTEYGTDHVAPVELLIESPFTDVHGHSWRGRTCWWEFSQDGMSPESVWWR